MEVIEGAHSVYRLQYHVVWVTKYRRRILKPFVKSYLERVLPKLLRSQPGVSMETIGFEEDHMHMVMVIPPRYAIAAVIGRLKSQSSSQMRKTFKWLSKVYWKENIVWSPGYFSSSIGVDENVIRRYVEYQGRKDSDQLRMEL
jgi:putative transposase